MQRVTVTSVVADTYDVRSVAGGPQRILGQVTVALRSNNFTVVVEDPRAMLGSIPHVGDQYQLTIVPEP